MDVLNAKEQHHSQYFNSDLQYIGIVLSLVGIVLSLLLHFAKESFFGVTRVMLFLLKILITIMRLLRLSRLRALLIIAHTHHLSISQAVRRGGKRSSYKVRQSVDGRLFYYTYPPRYNGTSKRQVMNWPMNPPGGKSWSVSQDVTNVNWAYQQSKLRSSLSVQPDYRSRQWYIILDSWGAANVPVSFPIHIATKFYLL